MNCNLQHLVANICIRTNFFLPTLELMRHVPTWKQKIAGKSLPMEKFAVAKADRFLAQGNHLVLPALELIYVWNGFKTLGKSWQTMDSVFVLVEKCLQDIELERGI